MGFRHPQLGFPFTSFNADVVIDASSINFGFAASMVLEYQLAGGQMPFAFPRGETCPRHAPKRLRRDAEKNLQRAAVATRQPEASERLKETREQSLEAGILPAFGAFDTLLSLLP